MKRADEWLREACSLLAEEETEQLEKSLNRKNTQEAEALFQRHKRQALRLIAKNSKKHRGFGPALRAAACLVLVIGAVWLVLSQESKEPTPLTPVYTASVAPYLSPSPVLDTTETPTPTVAPTPTLVPVWTPQATEGPEVPPQYFRTPSPVPVSELTPVPTLSQTEAPEFTSVPTFTPNPTSTPLPSPTPLNGEPVSEEDAYQEGLSGWGGNYFLGRFNADWQLLGLEQSEGCRRIEYRIGGISIAFTEYADSQIIDVPTNAELAYVTLREGVTALKMKLDDEVILAWEMGGQTLTLQGKEILAELMAASVEKISQP